MDGVQDQDVLLPFVTAGVGGHYARGRGRYRCGGRPDPGRRCLHASDRVGVCGHRRQARCHAVGGDGGLGDDGGCCGDVGGKCAA